MGVVGETVGDQTDRVLNVNVGILGHIDSGKTSLARALSTLLSTAALDKHPQSAERGITLDLGFSAFQVDVPASLSHLPYEKIQFTLVDCPGHASLIRTIIGGAQIIDVMLLVVDVTKGFQTQTAECLVVGEISPTQHMVVVLNKADMLSPNSKAASIEKMTKRVTATMKGTKFENPKIVATSVASGQPAEGVQDLIAQLMGYTTSVRREELDKPLLLAVDHCFPIKGQGTVMTGTVLQGRISVNDSIEIPSLKVQKKVKSMQIFHTPVSNAAQGDRVGVCVVQLDAKLLERGLVAAPGSVPTVSAIVASVERIRFHKSPVTSKMKYHVTISHTTVMAEVLFFRLPHDRAQENGSFDFNHDYLYCEDLEAGKGSEEGRKNAGESSPYAGPFWALLTFDSPVVSPPEALLIGSRLDFDVHSQSCRLAFHGKVAGLVDPGPGTQALRIFKVKRREGAIERIVDAYSAIGKGLFKKETDMSLFVGLKVQGPCGNPGVIQSSFGKSGKYKVVFEKPLPSQLEEKRIVLDFKRFLFDKTKTIRQ